jgi:hypothetical protein
MGDDERDKEPAVAPEVTQPKPPAPAPAKIIKAIDRGEWIELTVIFPDSPAKTVFALTPDDHYGVSDAMRAEYERAVAAGEIVPEQPPPEPEPQP